MSQSESSVGSYSDYASPAPTSIDPRSPPTYQRPVPFLPIDAGRLVLQAATSLSAAPGTSWPPLLVHAADAPP